MKLIFWCSLLIRFWFCLSQSEEEADYVCPELVYNENVDDGDVSCLLYQTNILNCSWSLNTLKEDTQLSVYVSTCHDDIMIHPPSLLSEGRVGSGSMVLREIKDELFVILQFITSNSSMHNNTVYSCEYESAMIEVVYPPPNISASFTDEGLLVTWGVPPRQTFNKPLCFEYELDMDDQKKPIHLMGQLSYKMLNADPTYTGRVRIRTKISDICFGPPDWSDWSDWSYIVHVEPSVKKANTQYSIPVIISISLGIPMILLAVLLLVRHQRMSKILFPPIPRPPAKYKNFLEKSDTFNIFHPVLSAKPEEEITEVQDAEQNPGMRL